MPTHNSVLLLGLLLAPAYATIATAQFAQAVCSCGFAHSSPCPTNGAPATAGVHGLMINESPDGSWLPAGHYHGDGHNHGAVAASAGGTSPVSAFQIFNRWTSTATDGFVGSAQGQPVTLTWGVAPDRTRFSNFNGLNGANTPNGSDLIAFLDANVGNAADAGITTVANKSWFPIIASAYERWGEVSGLNFVYEPNDDQLILTNSAVSRGVLGVRADMRLSGASFDGQSGSNVLAFNFFPNNGDGLIDTDNTNFFSNGANNFIGLRNVLAHEIGHGLGLAHVVSSDASFLLEPFINTSFDGPQLDDILAVQRSYGDPLENNGGNDTFGSATSIGAFDVGDNWAIGTDADGTRVEAFETDFISIDGLSDRDFFEFTVNEATSVDFLLTQVGPTYNEGPEGATPGQQQPLNTAALSNLNLQLFADSGSGFTSVELSSGGALSESIEDVELTPGIDYFISVQAEVGAFDNVQLYRLDLAFNEQVPEPSAAVLFALSLGFLGRRRAG